MRRFYVSQVVAKFRKELDEEMEALQLIHYSHAETDLCPTGLNRETKEEAKNEDRSEESEDSLGTCLKHSGALYFYLVYPSIISQLYRTNIRLLYQVMRNSSNLLRRLQKGEKNQHLRSREAESAELKSK